MTCNENKVRLNPSECSALSIQCMSMCSQGQKHCCDRGWWSVAQIHRPYLIACWVLQLKQLRCCVP
jgi:hypothetical protein